MDDAEGTSAVKEDELITLATASKLTGIPITTLRYAARVGNLVAQRTETPIGPVWQTTMREIERWRGTHTPHIKK